MEPHLHDQDQVLLDKLTYRFRDPKRYEIIVFPGPEGGDQFFVKRVIDFANNYLIIFIF